MDHALIADGWLHWFRRIGVAVLLATWFVTLLYASAQLLTLYRLQQEQQKLDSEMMALQAEHDAAMKEYSARLEYLERVLFGDVAPRVDKNSRGPVALEQRLTTADKELRDRIQALERWRLRMEEAR